MALMSLTLDKTIPTVADLLASPLAKYITLAANDCGYSGKAKELIVTHVHPLFLKAHSAASKADNPSWREATRASTWVFKCKRYPDGLIKKYKARLRARGDKQIKGTDFFDTYAKRPQDIESLGGEGGLFGRCDNILCGYLCAVTTVFSQQDGIYGFKFLKRFLEISSRDLTLLTLFSI
jgi:hypothetical protein